MPDTSRPVPFSRRARRAFAYGLGIGAAAPRTLSFALEMWLRSRNGHKTPGTPQLTAGLLAQVALDELILAAMKTPGRFPHRNDYDVARTDLLAAHELFSDRGWATDPRSYYAEPSPPEDVDAAPAWWMGPEWEHVRFESGFTPLTEGPSRERWLAREANATMHAFVRRAHGRSAPWVVCVHPFGTGQSMLGNLIFRANTLATDLDANVAMVVLPLHGARGGGWIAGGSAFMTYNPVDVLLGLTQSVWDVRRFLAWISAEGGGPAALYGVSLGAHVSAIVAGLDEALAGVVVGVPTCDILELFAQHIPRRLRGRAHEHRLIGPESRMVLTVTSPLSFPPLVPWDRLFIFAATGDRMSPPQQARTLWRHWGEPDMRWFDTNHVAFLWDARIAAFVRESLRRALDLPSAA